MGSGPAALERSLDISCRSFRRISTSGVAGSDFKRHVICQRCANHTLVSTTSLVRLRSWVQSSPAAPSFINGFNVIAPPLTGRRFRLNNDGIRPGGQTNRDEGVRIATNHPPPETSLFLYATVKKSFGGATLRVHQAAGFLIWCLPALAGSL
jgi:hypothetical protein